MLEFQRAGRELIPRRSQLARGPQNPESCPTRPGQNQQFALSISFVPWWPTKKKHNLADNTGESRLPRVEDGGVGGLARSRFQDKQHSVTLDKQNGEQIEGNVGSTTLHRFAKRSVSLGLDAFPCVWHRREQRYEGLLSPFPSFNW